jgi:hypothetical protein
VDALALHNYNEINAKILLKVALFILQHCFCSLFPCWLRLRRSWLRLRRIAKMVASKAAAKPEISSREPVGASSRQCSYFVLYHRVRGACKLDASSSTFLPELFCRVSLCAIASASTQCRGQRGADRQSAFDLFDAFGCHHRPAITTPSETILRSPDRCSPTTST